MCPLIRRFAERTRRTRAKYVWVSIQQTCDKTRRLNITLFIRVVECRRKIRGETIGSVTPRQHRRLPRARPTPANVCTQTHSCANAVLTGYISGGQLVDRHRPVNHRDTSWSRWRFFFFSYFLEFFQTRQYKFVWIFFFFLALSNSNIPKTSGLYKSYVIRRVSRSLYFVCITNI